MEKHSCMLCNNEAKYEVIDGDRTICVYDCPNCGKFSTSFSFSGNGIHDIERSKWPQISGYIRELNEFGREDVYISEENIGDILNSSIIARTVGEKKDKLLLFIDRHTGFLSDRVIRRNKTEHACCYAQNGSELNELLEVLRTESCIDYGDDFFQIKYKGAQRVEQLKKEISTSKSAFVAMWFDDDMEQAYRLAIQPAIEADELGGYKAFKVNNHEHNNDITDEIIAGIKACRFMVADLSGYRGGVYFEAGYAKGLGKPVIYTCRKDWFDGEKDEDGNLIKQTVHFDLTHENIIVWEDHEYLKKKDNRPHRGDYSLT